MYTDHEGRATTHCADVPRRSGRGTSVTRPQRYAVAMIRPDEKNGAAQGIGGAR